MRFPRRTTSVAFATLVAIAIFILRAQFQHTGAAQRLFHGQSKLEADGDKQQEQGDPGATGRNITGEDSDSGFEENSDSVNVPHTTAIASTAPSGLPDRVVVIGKLEREDTSWVADHLPDWQSAIYTVDNKDAALHTSINKGNEANPYLTYLVDNYDSLPSTIVFLHAHRDGYPVAWHTDAANHDNVDAVRNLNVDFIQRNGYANLRCIHDPGCPAEVQPFRDPPEDHRTTEHAMPDAWRALFNNSDVPRILATPCCSQFAVSRNQVRKRPWEDYRKYLDWLVETPLDDATSGRVFEYLWHIIFGQNPVYCPPLDQCYSNVYGKPMKTLRV